MKIALQIMGALLSPLLSFQDAIVKASSYFHFSFCLLLDYNQ